MTITQILILLLLNGALFSVGYVALKKAVIYHKSPEGKFSLVDFAILSVIAIGINTAVLDSIGVLESKVIVSGPISTHSVTYEVTEEPDELDIELKSRVSEYDRIRMEMVKDHERRSEEIEL